MLATICVLSVFVFCTVVAELGSNGNFVHAGSVDGLGVGIYWDAGCTNRTVSFNWGPIEAGSNNTLIIYIRNEMNYTPSNSSDYIFLNWNYSGQVLSADQVIPIELTLTILPNINGIDNFSFNTIISASGR
jgi:hypothetical protein